MATKNEVGNQFKHKPYYWVGLDRYNCIVAAIKASGKDVPDALTGHKYPQVPLVAREWLDNVIDEALKSNGTVAEREIKPKSQPKRSKAKKPAVVGIAEVKPAAEAKEETPSTKEPVSVAA